MNEASTWIDEEPQEEQLEDFVADLLSQKKYQVVIERLFAESKGVWASVKAHCTGAAHPERAWEWIGRLSEEDLVTTWMDYPGTPESEGLAIILFFYTRSYWSKAAFYNRKALPTRVAPRHEDEQKGTHI
jgi:hypothetical protein